MASRYAHDETYALRAEGLRSTRIAPGDSALKWRKIAAIAGAVLSAGALGTAYLKLEARSAYDGEATMNLEAQRAQLRGVASLIADASPTFSYEFIRPINSVITTFTDADVDSALYTYFMDLGARLAADSSLSPDDIHARQQELRGVWFQLSSCVRDVYSQWVEGKHSRVVPGDQFPIFRQQVLQKCPDAVAAFEATGVIAFPPPAFLAPFVLGGPGPVIFPEPLAKEPPRTAVEAPRVGEILSDPQPGPLAGQDVGFVANGPQRLKGMLLQAFGLGEPQGDEPLERNQSEEAPLTDEAANTAVAKAELREALLTMLASTKKEGQAENKNMQKAEKENPGRSSMTKTEFKALLTKHIESVLAVVNTGHLSTQHHALDTKHMLDKVQSCIDLATENAVDAATGEVGSNQLAESLDWILHACVDK